MANEEKYRAAPGIEGQSDEELAIVAFTVCEDEVFFWRVADDS